MTASVPPSVEELHEAARRARHSRELERARREEAELLLSTVAVLASGDGDDRSRVREALSALGGDESAVYLSQDGALQAWDTSTPSLRGLADLPAVRRTLEGRVTALYDTTRTPAWDPAGGASALLIPLGTRSRGVAVVTSRVRARFGRPQIRLAERLVPILEQWSLRFDLERSSADRARLLAANTHARAQLELLGRATRALHVGFATLGPRGDLAAPNATLLQMTSAWADVHAWWRRARTIAVSAAPRVVQVEEPSGAPRVFALSRVDALLLVQDVTARAAAERSLRTTSTRLEGLIRGLHAGVLVEDERSRIAVVNERFCELFGIEASPASLVGADCRQAAGRAAGLFVDPIGFTRRIEEILTARQLVENERLALSDGRVLERDYVPIFDDDSYRGHLWQYRDVTERARTQEALTLSEARNRNIVDASLDCVITIDDRGRVAQWNPAAEATFGWTASEAVGRPMAELVVPPRLRDAHRKGLARYRRERTPHVVGKRVELTGCRKGGEEFPCELAITEIPGPDGRPWFTGFLRDITERKETEEALRSAREGAERASEAKTRFLATMSHEMRTPLNAILGMTDLALEAGSDAERGEWLSIVHRSGETLLRLIDDLLDTSRIEAGELRFADETVDLIDAVESVVSLMRARSESKGLSLTARITPQLHRYVRGDAHRIRQILLNLVGNAIKFTAEGSVEVTLTAAESPPGQVAFGLEVRDTGVGIPPDAIDRVFERFYQVDSSDQRLYGGSGLGLAISRSLVTRMGGRIEVKSEPGRGTSFRVALSLPRSAPPERSAHVPGPARLTGKVLVAEDQLDGAILIRRWLERAGLQVTLVGDGDAAARLHASESFDLILLDLQMPGVDGLEAARRIRRQEAESGRAAVPVLAVSAHASAADRGACEAAGMSGFLPKPLRKDALLRALAARLSKRALVVDDCPDMRLLMGRHLERDGWAVTTVGTGDDACRAVATSTPDLVLLDLDLNGEDGGAVASRLRDGDYAGPVVALTGDTSAATAERCLTGHFARVLTKPVTRELLCRAALEAVGRR